MKRKKRSAFLILPALLLISLAIFGIRITLANLAMAREWRSGPIQNFNLETTSVLEIIPLYEETSTLEGIWVGHGVSYQIRTDSGTILLDAGSNPEQLPVPLFRQNMQALGISWDEIDSIVITHPHPDHIGGMNAWMKNTIWMGESSEGIQGIPVYVPVAMNVPGVVVSKAPVLISPDIATIGVISYSEVFPISLFRPKGTEQALVVNIAGEGLVLIIGCGHPGLERLFIRIESLYDLPVIGVVGGLHYEGFSADDVQPHIEFLKTHQIKLIAPSPHDSSIEALVALQSAFPESYLTLQVGESIQFPSLSSILKDKP